MKCWTLLSLPDGARANTKLVQTHRNRVADDTLKTNYYKCCEYTVGNIIVSRLAKFKVHCLLFSFDKCCRLAKEVGGLDLEPRLLEESPAEKAGRGVR